MNETKSLSKCVYFIASFLMSLGFKLSFSNDSTVVTPNHYSQVQRWNYSSISAPFFNQGEEIGRFNMGSTVIILFQARRVIWLPHLIELSRCRVGEGLARRLPCEL
jgi:phosphatidylserine decarboxylase